MEINATNFPDENFRKYVSENIDSDGDGKLSESEIKGCTVINCDADYEWIDVDPDDDYRGTLIIYVPPIHDLTGVEYFTALERLSCNYNNLSSLDVSKNTLLKELSCNWNDNLSSLDVSGSTALEELDCSFNDNLNSLNVSGATSLRKLHCIRNNNLSSLDVSGATSLEELDCQYNDNLSNLNVNGATSLRSLDCSNNDNLSSLDVSGATSLRMLDCSRNYHLSSLNVNGATALEELDCSYNKNLSSLDVSQNTSLRKLDCDWNDNLSSLDVNGATALEELKCHDNNLSILDVSENTVLQSLSCSSNNLSSLDVSKNTALSELSCGSNNLSSLDVSKNVALRKLSCSNNNLSNLNVNGAISLEELYCSSDNLSSLDVSKNTSLKKLSCSYSKLLSNLDVSGATSLEELDCRCSNLSSIDVSKNVKLRSFICYSQNKDVTVSGGTIALSAIDPNLKASAISNLKGATLFGDKLTNITGDTVTYDYATGYEDEKMDVTLKIKHKDITPESVSIDKKLLVLDKGKSEKLTATVNPDNVTNKGVTWSSSNTGVATVDANGDVKGIKPGTATITVKTEDGGKTASCTVTVKAPTIEATGIALDKKLLVLDKGKSGKLKATVKPSNTTNKTVAWSSSNTGVAKVDKNGNVTAVNHGTAKITAKTSNGKTATCEVRVNFADVANTSQYYYKPVYWAAENKIVTGANGLFAPHNGCTREHAITFLWRMAGKPEPKSMTSKFSDVKDTKRYYYKAIMWGTEKGIITGAGGKFAPGNTCTREQIVTMLWRMAGKPAPKSTNVKFSDMTDKNRYSYKAVLWAAEKGIATGQNGKFAPAKTCTRAEIVTFIYRYKNTVK